MFWMMRPLLNADYDTTSYIGGQEYTGSSSSFTSLGALAGDMAVALVPFSSVTSGSGQAWNAIPIGSNLNLYWKPLIAADMSGGIVNSGGSPGDVRLYRNASKLTLSSTTAASGVGPNNIAGFPPSIGHAGLIAVTRAFGTGQEAGVLTPTTWADRGGVSFFSDHAELSDRLSPPNHAYSGQDFTTTGNSPASYNTYIIEFIL